jgi:hypothetical protein
MDSECDATKGKVRGPPIGNERHNRLTVDQVYQFFEALLNKCKQKDIYSVIETAEEMGVPYAKVKEWACENEDWNNSLEMSRCHCACHAHHDWSSFKLSEKLGIKYCLENDEEFAEANKEYEAYKRANKKHSFYFIYCGCKSK